MKESEITAFERRRGYQPTRVRVAIEALAVIVHVENPIQGMSFEELEGIYAEGGELKTWVQLGVEIPGFTGARIVPVGRQSSSGTYEYFRERVLGAKGAYGSGMIGVSGSCDVVDLVARTPGAIGYAGFGFLTSRVRAVPLAEKAGGEPVAGAAASFQSGEYPLAHDCLLYVDKPPGRPLEPPLEGFLRFVLSREGQELAVRAGFASVQPAEIKEEILRLRA
jgi:phosphate transport system substrate-binding protein